MRWRSASLAACSAALLLAGCGDSRARLPVLTAVRLTHLAERGDCAGLQRATIAAINRGEVPAALQEELLSDVNEAAAVCSPTALRALAERLRP